MFDLRILVREIKEIRRKEKRKKKDRQIRAKIKNSKKLKKNCYLNRIVCKIENLMQVFFKKLLCKIEKVSSYTKIDKKI